MKYSARNLSGALAFKGGDGEPERPTSARCCAPCSSQKEKEGPVRGPMRRSVGVPVREGISHELRDAAVETATGYPSRNSQSEGCPTARATMALRRARKAHVPWLCAGVSARPCPSGVRAPHARKGRLSCRPADPPARRTGRSALGHRPSGAGPRAPSRKPSSKHSRSCSFSISARVSGRPLNGGQPKMRSTPTYQR